MASKQRRKKPSSENILLFFAVIFVVLFFSIVGSRLAKFVAAGADRTPPTLTVLTPQNGQTIGDGSNRMYFVLVSASATDASGVHRVYLIVDDQQVGYLTAPPGNDRYITNWNVTQAANGPHKLEIKAEDKRGNTISSYLDVTLNNGPRVDFTPPLITITSPADNSTVDGRSDVTIRWKASENESILTRVLTYVYGLRGARSDFYCGWASASNNEEGNCTFTVSANSGDTLTVESVANDIEGNTGKSSIKLRVQ